MGKGMNESIKMKTALKLILFFLGVSLPCIAFAGLVGIAAPGAFFSSEVILSVFAVVGLALVSVNDYTYRRPTVQISSAPVCPVVTFHPAGGHRGGMDIAA